MNKRGLGRGLSALIPEASGDEGDRVLSLPIGSIEPNPLQPRKDFAEDEITKLAESIHDQGLLQPILVRRRDAETYELISGERRWRAARLAGFDQIPAIIRDTADEQMLPLALIENLLREDLNPIEQAEAFRELTEAGLSQEEIARQVGKGRAQIANTLRLLRLPGDIKDEVASGKLTAGHARTLLSCETEAEMRELRERILSQDLTVREAEIEKVPPRPAGRKKSPRRSRTRRAREVSPETREMEERLQRVFGTPVQIHDKNGRGRVWLEFYSYEDLDRLTDLLFAAEPRPPSTQPPH